MTSATKQRGKTKSSVPAASPPVIELPEGTWERISSTAFDLWQERGCRDGHALEDWLDAEAKVMRDLYEACE